MRIPLVRFYPFQPTSCLGGEARIDETREQLRISAQKIEHITKRAEEKDREIKRLNGGLSSFLSLLFCSYLTGQSFKLTLNTSSKPKSSSPISILNSSKPWRRVRSSFSSLVTKLKFDAFEVLPMGISRW